MRRGVEPGTSRMCASSPVATVHRETSTNTPKELSVSEHPSPDRIMQVGFGFWASKTLLSAIELGLFTELARQPEAGGALEQRLGLHPRSAPDFLDALVRSVSSSAATGSTATPQRPIFSSTKENLPISGGCSRWRTTVSTGLGSPHRGFAHGTVAERSEGGRDAVLRTLYAEPDRLGRGRASRSVGPRARPFAAQRPNHRRRDRGGRNLSRRYNGWLGQCSPEQAGSLCKAQN